MRGLDKERRGEEKQRQPLIGSYMGTSYIRKTEFSRITEVFMEQKSHQIVRIHIFGGCDSDGGTYSVGQKYLQMT